MDKNALVKNDNLTFDKKRVIINEYDYLKEIDMQWSIDRITLVGKLKDNIAYHHQNGDIYMIDFEMLMRINEGNGYLESVNNRAWVLKDKYSENIAYIEILKFQRGYGRIDFNPNTIKKFLHDGLKRFIHDLFDEPHFSRADIACDIINIDDDFISQYRMCEPVKFNAIYGKSGKLETAYFGSSGSEKQVRMYNKLLERTKKHKIIPDDVKTWWRVEMQLRRSKASEWQSVVNDSLKCFASPHYFPNDISTIERCVLKGLLFDHSEWDNLPRATKYRYRKLMLKEATNDQLTQNMLKTFHESAAALKDELDTWLIGLDVTNSVDDDTTF